MTRMTITGLVLLLMLPTALMAQYPNIRVSRPESTDPEEVTIAINPANPLNLAAGANLNFIYSSTDGGLTWTEDGLTSTLGVWGDPSVAFDADGNLYYAHLSNPPAGNWIDRIVVQKSTDGGMTWSDGIGVGLNSPKQQDKEWIVADLTDSQYKNNLYMSWTEFDRYGSSNPNDSTRILFSRSIDHGVTWSQPLKVSDVSGDCIDSDNTVEGAVPAVGPNGEIYVSWAGPLGIMFDKSIDGGLTFGADIFVTSQPGGWDFEVSGISRCNGLPVTVCDVSNSPNRGHIYVLWGDQRNGEEDTDVFLIKSTDGGETWGEPKRVNTDTTLRHQFFPWIAVDPFTGIIYVVFYDRRNTANDATEVYVARSEDGGASFDDFKVSESPFTPRPQVFFGDYTNIAARDGKIYPIWMRMDNSNLSIWTAIISDPVTGVSERKADNIEGFRLSQNYPNPLPSAGFDLTTTITFRLPFSQGVSLKLYDVSGREVAAIINNEQAEAGEHTVRFDTGKLMAGVYFYKLTAGQLSETKKLLILK